MEASWMRSGIGTMVTQRGAIEVESERWCHGDVYVGRQLCRRDVGTRSLRPHGVAVSVAG